MPFKKFVWWGCVLWMCVPGWTYFLSWEARLNDKMFLTAYKHYTHMSPHTSTVYVRMYMECICMLKHSVGVCCAYVCLADSGSKLEIKTLCGTQPMIGLELKQKSRKKQKSMLKNWRGDRKEAWGEVVSSCLCCILQLVLDCFLSECQADRSYWLASVSSLPKMWKQLGKLRSQRNIFKTH